MERKSCNGYVGFSSTFLGLTARKTNVEYEGQQVNQQRTTLSNQSANYYNNLLGMEVPVPPSVADYTKQFILSGRFFNKFYYINDC